MVRKTLDVFLSSTAVDLAEHRVAVHERLARTAVFQCHRFEDRGPQSPTAIEYCATNVHQTDIFVGLVGHRRGWEPEGDNAARSITEMEHDWASAAGKPQYIWVAPDDFLMSAHGRETDQQHARQQHFRTRLQSEGRRVVSKRGFTSPAQLASDVTEHLLSAVISTHLILSVRPEIAFSNVNTMAETQSDVTAALTTLSGDNDIDLELLARETERADFEELEAKLRARAEAREKSGRKHSALAASDLQSSSLYWSHAGFLALHFDTEAAQDAFKKATKLDPLNARAWRGLGECQFMQRKLTVAQKSFQVFLDVATTSNDMTARADALLRLAWIERMQRNFPEADSLARRSLELHSLFNNRRGIARCFNELSIILRRSGRIDEATSAIECALDLETTDQNMTGIARAHMNMGNIYRKQGNSDAAKTKLQHALAIHESQQNKYGSALTLVNLMRLFALEGDTSGADQAKARAIKLLEDLGIHAGSFIRIPDDRGMDEPIHVMLDDEEPDAEDEEE